MKTHREDFLLTSTFLENFILVECKIKKSGTNDNVWIWEKVYTESMNFLSLPFFFLHASRIHFMDHESVDK